MKKMLFTIVLSFSSLLLAKEFNPLYNTPTKTKFAILIASYNNEHWVEWNLNSALSQDYDPELFHIYYLNDCSTDHTLEKAQEFVKRCQKEHLVTFVNNPINLKPIGNYYVAIHKYVPDDHVVVILDGDDALAHNDVLAYLNKLYSNPHEKILLTYGQFKEKNSGAIGFCSPYPNRVLKCNLFRKYVHIPSHLRTFYSWLFKKIKKEDLLYKGRFLPMSGDVGSMFPMIEMALGHFRFIPDVLYIYNDQNPLSEHLIAKPLQREIDQFIRAKAPYEPLDPRERRRVKRVRHFRKTMGESIDG